MVRGMRPLRHIRQVESWDCGIACALMVLISLEKDDKHEDDVKGSTCSESIIDKSLRTLSSPFLETKSVWTIDVALILAKRGVNVKLYTTFDISSMTINQEYKNFDFYRDHYDNDSRRIPALFQEFYQLMSTTSAKSTLIVCQLSLEVLKSNLLCSGSSYGVILYIILVDSNILNRIKCSIKKNQQDLTNTSFNGHFIILTRYDPSNDQFEFIDPASPHEQCFTSSTNLDKARSSLGTDDDIIEIPLHS
jgi:hypothetical protein